MESGIILGLLFGPGIIALVSAGAAVWMFNALDRAERPASRVLLWIGVVVCSLIAFGIGTCYAMMFTGGFR